MDIAVSSSVSLRRVYRLRNHDLLLSQGLWPHVPLNGPNL